MTITQKTQIRRLARSLADGHVDASGCVNMTALAEEIADALDIDAELDDETSDLWTIVADVSEKLGLLR
jgi:hypothetical protein